MHQFSILGQEERRVKESKRLGFTTIISPEHTRNLKLAQRLVE